MTILDFKKRESLLPNVMILAAMVLLLGSLLVMLFVKMPTTDGLARGRGRTKIKREGEIEAAKSLTRTAILEARPRLWTGDPRSVTASALAQLSQAARAKGLQFGAFRPQKTQSLSGLTELPFSLQLSGPFPAVRAFLSGLDSPNSRLALRTVQIASSDGSSDAVTATVSISAYIDTKESEKKPISPAPTPAPKLPLSAQSVEGGGRG